MNSVFRWRIFLSRKSSNANGVGRPRQALLIDDEAFTDKTLTETLPQLLLSRAELQLVAADAWDDPSAEQRAKPLIEGGSAALPALKLIFLDIVFPQGQPLGDEILRSIRAVHPELPVVILTARSENSAKLLQNLCSLRVNATQPKSELAKEELAPAVEKILLQLAPPRPPFKLQLTMLDGSVSVDGSAGEEHGHHSGSQSEQELTQKVIVQVLDQFNRPIFKAPGVVASPGITWILLRCEKAKPHHSTTILNQELKRLSSGDETWDRDRIAKVISKFNERVRDAGLPFQLLVGWRELKRESKQTPQKGKTYQQINELINTVEVIYTKRRPANRVETVPGGVNHRRALC
jgi:CheY-like chemotaxis protein